MKKISYVLKCTGMILLICLMLLLAAGNLSTWTIKNKILEGERIYSGYSSAVVVSESMEPHIAVQDMVVTKAQNSYQVNDVIMYLSESNSLVTHRVVETDANGYITKGDANYTTDGVILKQRILGKLIFLFPKVGLVTETVHSPAGLGVLFAAWIVIIFFLPKRYDKKKKETKTSEI